MKDSSQWYIELRDTVINKIASCDDMDEFSATVEEFGIVYGGHIDEVRWNKDENIPPHIMDEIRLEMARHQEEIEKTKEK
ncbi:MAG: hypothetical protein KKB50_11205 [Planctomycetes bacterium]|nr:hypothetical protein [Planctomycetota bacterium]